MKLRHVVYGCLAMAMTMTGGLATADDKEAKEARPPRHRTPRR